MSGLAFPYMLQAFSGMGRPTAFSFGQAAGQAARSLGASSIGQGAGAAGRAFGKAMQSDTVPSQDDPKE